MTHRNVRLSLFATLSLALTVAASGQQLRPGRVPSDVILVPGAVASATDHVTPLPEGGRIVEGVYRNAYFGIDYPLPAEMTQPYDGPPPSERGAYVLSQLVTSENAEQKATLLITASDTFFSLLPARNAIALARYQSEALPDYYKLEQKATEVQLGGRKFARFDYMSEVAGLHWIVLTTDSRCHTLQFVLTGRDVGALEKIVDSIGRIVSHPESEAAAGDVPVCIADYSTGANVLSRVEPTLPPQKYNSIPVRVIIDEKGRVRHIHFISAFPDQSKAITDALLQWRFKPYILDGHPAEVETGIMFGAATPQIRRAAASDGTPSRE